MRQNITFNPFPYPNTCDELLPFYRDLFENACIDWLLMIGCWNDFLLFVWPGERTAGNSWRKGEAPNVWKKSKQPDFV